MELQYFIYPNPKLDKKKLSELMKDIIYIDSIQVITNKKKQIGFSKKIQIPCLYNKVSEKPTKHIILYLHGNGEDILSAKDLSDSIKSVTQVL
jgi:hypothetical protein